MKKITYLITFYCLVNLNVFGQKTTIFVHKNATYNTALELYDKEKFSAAQDKFAQVLLNIEDKNSEIAVNAQYYQAICGLELFNIDAENLLVEFIYAYPESPKIKLAYYHLGRYKFRKKRYDEALNWFSKIDIYDLSDNDLAEYYFKKGYAQFKEEHLNNASKSFYEIKDVDTKYKAPARYYYAHIAYLQKKHEAALQTFLSLSDNEKFSPIVPYYVTQIYFLQKKYDQLIAYAPSLLENASPKRAAEISRLLGEAYYNTEKFDTAITYLKRYQKEKPYLAKRSDKYQLGYAYYKTKDYPSAIDWFKKSIKDADSLSQVSHYHLAECYLKLDKKKYAQNSFRIASDLNSDPEIKEDALFSFAKISYELSLHPYNDAIIAFEEFINTYPNSKKLNNAYEFLVAVYFTTKNYKGALASLERINNKNIQLKDAYQKIAYYRGVELFNNRKYPEAILHFDKSDTYPLDKKIKADNSYWRAETNYRLKKYQDAIGEYKKFIFEPTAIASNDINKAHYSIGYSYFKLKEYSNANQWFRKYIQNNGMQNTKTKNDALNRIGDCFFIEKKYQAAIEYYDKAAMIGLDKADYSLFQSAITNGVIGNYKDKKNLLKTLINRPEKSHLMDDAIYHLGKTQEILTETDGALKSFELLIKNHPNSPYLSEALIKEGLIYYNKKEDNKALVSFKQVVKNYPNTTEAIEAIEQIKKIHIDKGELALYEEYIKTIGILDSSAQVMDADYYEVAENSYMKNNCDKAVTEFARYLEKYPNGIYQLNAHFYRADCEYRAGFENEALLDFSYVLKQSKNKFTETSLLKSAKINVNLGRMEAALNNYNKLEYLADIPANLFKAQTEQMRLNYKLNNYDATIKYAELIIDKDIDDPNLITECHLIYGKSVMAKDNYNLALTEFTTASSSDNKFGAEAKFNLAYILFLRGEYDNCETEIFSFIKKFSSYSYWTGKSLILLSDNYVAKEDLFQAKLTLKNTIDNNKYPELVSTAKEKLELIERQEVSHTISSDTSEINLDLFDEDDMKLFNEDEEIIEEELPNLKREKNKKPENTNSETNGELEETGKDE